jgi:hypothetical protein
VNACTRPNPAYQRLATHGDGDVVEVVPDAGGAAPDVVRVEEDVSPDLPEPPPEADAAPAPPDLEADLTPALPDLAPELPPPADSLVTRMLVAHWRFDEGKGTAVRDDTGLGNNGVTKGDPIWTGAASKIRFVNTGALLLDGQNDWVELTPNAMPASDAPKSLSLWFKANAPAASPIRDLLGLFNDTADTGIQLGLHSGKLAVWFYGDLQPRLTGGPALDSAWHHAAYTFDGTTHRLYLDGVQIKEGTPVPRHGATLTVRIGTYDAPAELFSGAIDDARVYARALDFSEVTTLAAGQ